MATNSIQIPVNDNEHTASLTACSSSKKTFVQCISKLRNRIFHTAAIERTNTASPATIVPPHPQLEAETLSKLYIPGSFPSDSSLILTRRLADKHAIFASKFDTLTHSFNLGLQVQGISDPKVAQDVLLRYHHKYNNQLQPDKGETEFNLIHKQLAQECLILASSLSRKICPGSRLKTCLDLVSALESTTTTRSLQHPQASDDDDDEDRDYGSEPTCSFGVEFHSRSQLFAYGISGNNAPSTPGDYSCHSSPISFSFPRYSGKVFHDYDNQSRPQSPNTEPDDDHTDPAETAKATNHLALFIHQKIQTRTNRKRTNEKVVNK